MKNVTIELNGTCHTHIYRTHVNLLLDYIVAGMFVVQSDVDHYIVCVG